MVNVSARNLYIIQNRILSKVFNFSKKNIRDQLKSIVLRLVQVMRRTINLDREGNTMNKKHNKIRSNKRIFKNGLIFSVVFVATIFLPLTSLVIDIGVGSDDTFIERLRTSESEAWNANGASICPAPDDQWEPHIISDGAGGAIITWKDDRNSGTTGSDIYAQKINSAGIAQWDVNGTLICNAAGDQLYPQLASDGAGGAIITWNDERVHSSQDDLYVQRINSAGTILWETNGVLICNEAAYQYEQQIISDGAGGAIIVWGDMRTFSTTWSDLYAQKVNSVGIPQWDDNGTLISNAFRYQREPKLVSDGAGGAIITWEDDRDDPTTEFDIYAQMIDSAGNTQWDDNGTIICNENGNQFNPRLVNDDAGGAIITWQDQRHGANDIYAQKVNSEGVGQWADHWTLISNETGNQMDPQITSDGAGGAIITWQDERLGTGDDNIYVQKVNTVGVAQWDDNGTLICDATDEQKYPQIASDCAGGAIITWQDPRFGAADIYVQKINSSGSTQWDDNGKLICNAIEDQWYPKIASDGNGGALITWQDHRNTGTTGQDIYAQKIADPLPGGGGDGFPWLDLVTFGLNTGLSFAIGLILGIFLMKRRK